MNLELPTYSWYWSTILTKHGVELAVIGFDVMPFQWIQLKAIIPPANEANYDHE